MANGRAKSVGTDGEGGGKSREGKNGIISRGEAVEMKPFEVVFSDNKPVQARAKGGVGGFEGEESRLGGRNGTKEQEQKQQSHVYARTVAQ